MEYITIDKTIKKAIYIQIADSIREAIISGRLKDMDKLPTENELCDCFEISDIVVKRAYSVLVEDKLVRRIQGSGTFVTTRETYRFPLRMSKHIEFQPQYNYQSKFKRILLLDLLKPKTYIAEALQISNEDLVYMVKFVVYIDKSPVLLQTSYFPISLYPKMNTDMFHHHALPLLIENYFSYHLTSIKSMYFPMNLSSYDASLLSMMKHDPAHLIKSTFYSNDQSVCYAESLFPGPFTEFEVML